jgi:hypothetical protein
LRIVKEKIQILQRKAVCLFLFRAGKSGQAFSALLHSGVGHGGIHFFCGGNPKCKLDI